MLIGYLTEYKGYEGTIEYDYEDNIHYGKLLNIKESVVAKNINIIFAFKSNLSL